VSYHNAFQDPNAVAWMIGRRNPALDRDLEHRRALAEARDHSESPTARVRRAIRSLDPRPQAGPTPDCCPA
jgi:hypothetical protein